MDHQAESDSVSAVSETNWESLICAEPEDSNFMMQLLDFGSFNSLDPSVYCPEHNPSSPSYYYCSTDGSNSYSGCYYLDESNSAVFGRNPGFIPMEQQLMLDETSNGSSESWELENGGALKKARAATNVSSTYTVTKIELITMMISLNFS